MPGLGAELASLGNLWNDSIAMGNDAIDTNSYLWTSFGFHINTPKK